MPSFGNLSSDAGLQQLNNYIVEYSYINGFRPTQDDAAVFGAIASCPNAAKFPHAARWWNHIAGFSAAARAAFPGSVTVAVAAPAAAAAAAAGAGAGSAVAADDAEAEDVDFDAMFGDDDDDAAPAASKKSEADEEAENRRLIDEENKRRADAARGNKKAARSQIVFDVKPWDEDTNLEELAAAIKQIEMEGVNWGEGHKLEPLAYGINKLQVSAVLIDDLVSTELLMEKIQEMEDYVQSVDIFAFNKL